MTANKLHRLVKKTESHLIVVCYELRDRLVVAPTPETNPELILRLQPHSFGHFLKKHGMVPPNMMGREFDDDYIMKEDIEEKRNPVERVVDHEDDRTLFDITMVNKNDSALNMDCTLYNGEIIFGKVRVFDKNGLWNAK